MILIPNSRSACLRELRWAHAHHRITVRTLDGSVMSAFLAWPEVIGGGRRPWCSASSSGSPTFSATPPSAWPRWATSRSLPTPDRRGPRPAPREREGRQRGLALTGELTRLELVSDARDALEAARDQPEADPEAPSVALGMSFGGHVAILAAARLGLHACVALYAGWLAETEIAASRPEPTGSLPLAGRLMILAGEADPMVPISGIDSVRAWHPEAEVITYPGIGHRFCSLAGRALTRKPRPMRGRAWRGSWPSNRGWLAASPTGTRSSDRNRAINLRLRQPATRRRFQRRRAHLLDASEGRDRWFGLVDEESSSIR